MWQKWEKMKNRNPKSREQWQGENEIVKSFINLSKQERVVEDAVCWRGVDRASGACRQASRQVLPLTQSKDHLTLYWFHSSGARYTHTHKIGFFKCIAALLTQYANLVLKLRISYAKLVKRLAPHQTRLWRNCFLHLHWKCPQCKQVWASIYCKYV